jgi:hypothetical protein
MYLSRSLRTAASSFVLTAAVLSALYIAFG